MTRYAGRHRSPAAPAPEAARAHRHQAPPKRRVARPVVAAGLALGLGLTAIGYAAATGLGSGEAAFVVGDGLAAQTEELARTSVVDTAYRAAASVSRNERRTAIAAAGVATAQQVEAKAKIEAEKQAQALAEQQKRQAAEAARVQAIAAARDNPRAAARVLMADHGWTSDAQYNCLVNLWNGESAWRFTATNQSSGAYGIPQSLPGNKMAKFGNDWQTNPVTQMRWGLWYIEQSYGNPCNAWSFWLSKSPHWY
ncbi:MAG: lytic transglycosylase domain-containing protein [Intrasporangium sp.]|uniref:aggregation-promoting factor C-terminal-like domain-containing protein n=1 Tax=Intrasporangium sp. TaxID=1925024 RepID=UPI003F7DE7B8